jgi:hypothetical protein
VWNDLLKPYGLQIRADMVYDLAANQIVPLPSDMGQVLQPYPLWLRARPTGSVIGEGVGEVFLPWTSSIDTTGAKGWVTPLLLTSNAAGVAEQEVDISPTREFPPVDLKTRILAATSSPSAKDSTAPKGRVAVVGSSDFVSGPLRLPRHAERGLYPERDRLAGADEALHCHSGRDRRPPPLVYSSAGLREGVKYANVILLPVLIMLGGTIHLLRRRRQAGNRTGSSRPLRRPRERKQLLRIALVLTRCDRALGCSRRGEKSHGRNVRRAWCFRARQRVHQPNRHSQRRRLGGVDQIRDRLDGERLDRGSAEMTDWFTALADTNARSDLPPE